MWKKSKVQGVAATATPRARGGVSLTRVSHGLVLAVGIVLLGAALFAQQLFVDLAERYYQQRVTLLATNAARQAASVMTGPISAVRTAAQAPELASALLAQDGGYIAAQEDALRARLAGAVRVRLIQPGAAGEQGAEYPALTFADLELVRTISGGVGSPVEAHLPGSPLAHIDIVNAVPSPAGVAGFLLVSYPVAGVQDALAHLSLPSGYIEIHQGTGVVLASRGDTSLVKDRPARHIALPGTRWEMYYWPPVAEGSVLRQQLWFCGIFGAAFLLIWGVIWVLNRWVTRAVHRDLGTLTEMARDLRNGHGQPVSYPVQLADFKGTVELMNALRHMPANTAPVEAAATTTPPPSSPALSALDINLSTPSTYFPEELTPMNDPATARARGGNLPASIFRAYDIRGIVGDTLTEDIVYDIGRAIGSEAYARGQQSVIVARDGRLSGPALLAALSDGLRASGRDVIDIGQVPTPVLYFAAHYLNTESGVMLTGSHNPPAYNGLKMVLRGETLAEEDIQALRRRIETGDVTAGSGSVRQIDVAADYIHRITSDVHMARPLKVVVDCGNGVAGELAPRLLRELGCEVFELFCEVDGEFPNHHPDPSQPENLHDLIEAVRARGADLGLAFDGDGDRLGVVDGKGAIIWPDRQMMLYARDILTRHPGAQIMFDVKCTRHLARVISKHGGQPMMWKTGHSLIKRKMKETGALLAGEMSGHIFFKERWFGFDDALYTAARLLEILSADTRSAQAVFAELPDAVNTPELRVDLKEGEQIRVMQRIVELAQFKGAVVTNIDGLRVDFEDGWGLVRASNTTPSLILRFEATTPAAIKRIQQEFRQLMLKAEPALVLPF